MKEIQKHEDRNKPSPQKSFRARVATVHGSQGGCKTVSLTLDADPRESKIRRAVLIGIESRRRSSGVLVNDAENGTRAHIFYDAKTLRRLPKGASVQVDWSPVGDQLMTNIALTITDPDYGKEDPQEG